MFRLTGCVRQPFLTSAQRKEIAHVLSSLLHLLVSICFAAVPPRQRYSGGCGKLMMAPNEGAFNELTSLCDDVRRKTRRADFMLPNDEDEIDVWRPRNAMAFRGGNFCIACPTMPAAASSQAPSLPPMTA